MRKPGRGQILENRLVGPREVLGGGDRRVPAKGRGRTAPCRGRSGASWIWATPLTPARARGSSVRATPSLRPPRILKTSLFLQKGGPRKEPSQRTATALFYLIPCGDFQLSPREFYLSLITPCSDGGMSGPHRPASCLPEKLHPSVEKLVDQPQVADLNDLPRWSNSNHDELPSEWRASRAAQFDSSISSTAESPSDAKQRPFSVE